MKYLPAFALGLLLAIVSFSSFSLVAELGYMRTLLESSWSHRNELYLGLAAHDVGLLLIFSGTVLYAYRVFFPRFPFDWFAAVGMQLPLGLAVLWLDGISLNIFSFYGIAKMLTTLAATFGVLMIFSLWQRSRSLRIPAVE